MRAHYWIAAGFVALLVLGGGTAAVVVVQKKKAARALNANDAPDGGFLPADPRTLASTNGIYVDVETLARVASSEAGDGSEEEQIAVMWIAMNQARRLGKGITEAVTIGSSGRGHYGAQNAGGRWISTRFASTPATRKLAQQVFDGKIPDNTGGATKFMHVATQTAMNKKKPATNKPPAAVIADWRGEGFVPYSLGAVPASRFLIFRREARPLVAVNTTKKGAKA